MGLGVESGQAALSPHLWGHGSSSIAFLTEGLGGALTPPLTYNSLANEHSSQ